MCPPATGNGTFTRAVLMGSATLDERSCPFRLQGSEEPLGATGTQSACVKEASVWVDRSHSGGLSKTSWQGGPVALPEGGLLARDLQLALFVDRSLLEVYALGGRATVTSRIYPLPVVDSHVEALLKQGAELTDVQLGAWGLQLGGLWNAGSLAVTVQAWELESCWVDEL